MDKKFLAIRAEWIGAIMLSVIFGFLCVFPNIAERFDKKYGYQGIVMMPTDQEFYYGGRAAAIARGEWPVTNQYYVGPKDQPYLQPAFPEAVIVFTGKFLGLKALTSFILSKFLLGFLLIVVFFGATQSLTKKPWISLAAVSAVIFANAALNAPWDIFQFIETGIVSSEYLRFSRPINPQWSATWFFVCVWILSEWIHTRKRLYAVALGICMAILLYSYVYAWTYLGVTFGLLCLWYAYKRKWSYVTDIFFIGVIFLVLGIFYFMNMWELTHHPWYPETAARQGLIHKRYIVLGVYSILFFVLSLPSKKFFPRSWPLLPCLALGGLIAANQQLITGTAIVVLHYHWYFIQPLAAMLLIVTFFVCIRQKNIQTILIAATVIFSVAFGTLQQSQAYLGSREEWSSYQNFAPVFDELDSIGRQGEVVFASRANKLLRDLIQIYTPLSVYIAGNSNGYLTPQSRARDVMFFELWLEGLSAEEAEKRFPADLRAFVSSKLFSIYYREFTGQYEGIPDSIIGEQIEKYAEYLSLSSNEKLTLYPLDFVIHTYKDPDTEGWKTLRSLGTEIYNQDSISVIQFKR